MNYASTAATFVVVVVAVVIAVEFRSINGGYDSAECPSENAARIPTGRVAAASVATRLQSTRQPLVDVSRRSQRLEYHVHVALVSRVD